MNVTSADLKNAFKVILLPVFVYVLFFICSGGNFGKPASIIMNLKQTLAPTLISYAMCCNMLCDRMDLSAGAVVMLSAMLGAKMVYLYGIGLVPFALIVVGSAVILGIISGIMYLLMRVPAIVTALGVCMIYETLSNLASISWVTAISGEITTFGRFPYCLIVFIAMFILFYIIFNYTKFGYNVRACASSQQIARNAGVNTMNTITYLAQKGRNDDVIAVNKAMIEILKDRLRIDLEDVYDTVQQEIKVTRQYLIIQDYRYAGTFKTVIQVEEDVQKYYIAKNIIQPLVENALFHGILCNKDEEGEVIGGCIKINVFLKKPYINIIVEDNGTGMALDVLEELENQSLSKIRGKHIGIRNIKGRIRYIYGEDCYFNISSKEGEGTKVVVKMPVIKDGICRANHAPHIPAPANDL